MKNAIIIHGKPSKVEYFDLNLPSASNFSWIPWLQKQLVISGVPAQTPEMFNAWRPDYSVWSKTLDSFELTPETVLVGHSCGAGFIVQWLSEHKDVSVGKVILVAPWLGPISNDETGSKPIGGFFELDIDAELGSRVKEIVIFNSDNDAESIHSAVGRIRKRIPTIKYVEFHNYDHFCFEDSKKAEFPELLEECLR